MTDIGVGRRLLVDWVPSFALAGIGAHELLYNHAPWWQWATAAVLVLALPLRRRAPELVLALALAMVAVDWANDVLLVVDLGVFVALHAVAWRRPRPHAVVAAVVVQAAAVYASFRFGPVGSVNDAVVLLTGLTLAAVALGVAQRTQEERTEQLRQERNRSAVLAAAEERTRIAREVHDIVAHSVSVMVAMSEAAARTPDPETSRSSMRQVAATGRQALIELRRVLAVLHDEDDDDRSPQPSLAALSSLAGDVERAGLAVRLRVDGHTDSLPEALQSTVYRIVQESLTNTMKHADRPSRASVRIAVDDAHVSVEVTDDGRSVVPLGQAGNGIRGMGERARMYGGTVLAGARDDGAGWTVRCVLDRTETVVGAR